MSTSGNKQVIWASVLLMLWGVVMIILLVSGVLVDSFDDNITSITYVWGYAACVFAIIGGILAFKFKNDRKKTLWLNILGILTAALAIIFMVTSWEDVASLIGAFLSLMYMGGINRNARYLKKLESENK